MKIGNVLLIGGGAAAVLYFLAREKNTVDQITTGVVGIKYNKLNSGILNTELLVKIRVTNPTPNPVNFTGFSAMLTVNGKKIASATTNNRFDSIRLSPGNTDIELPISFKHIETALGVVDLLTKLLTKKITELPILVMGSIQVAGLQIPINQVYNINMNTFSVNGVGRCVGKENDLYCI